MSCPSERTRPRAAASSTLVPTPSVEATSTGSSIDGDRLRREGATEAADPANHLGTVGPLDGAAHPRDGAVALGDVDARRRVAGERRAGGAPGDVAPHLHAGEVDVGQRAVGVGAGGLEVVTDAGDGEHPPAAGVPVGEPGREDHGVVQLERQRHEVAQAWRSGIPGRRGDDGARRRGAHMQRARWQGAAGRGEGQLGEIGVEQRQQRLGLGIAEAHVVLDESRSVGGEHQAGVEEADVRRARGGEVVEHRLEERTGERVEVEGERGRGVGAHPAGVGTGVAFADALVVLGEREGHGAPAVAQSRSASTPDRSSAPRARTSRRRRRRSRRASRPGRQER